MKVTPEHIERVSKLTFASVYPHYIAKIERKGRNTSELHELIEWLTVFDEKKLKELEASGATFKEFFEQANMNPNAALIKGVICGYRIEEIENELTRNVRYLDKIVDELSKGKAVEKIKRVS